MKIDIDIENIDSLENREKLSILSNDILIELLLRNIELVANYKNIIKEVREYIESYMPNYDFDKTNLIKLLGILDKGE